MKEIRLGLIGAGGIAQHHCRTIEQVPGLEVRAVCDIDGDRARRTAETFDIPHVFDGYEGLLELDELDAVLVCTPNAHHAEPSIAAMRSGKHVLCEKPMSASLDDAVAMVRAARETGRILMVALKLRYTPPVQVARRIVGEGTLGDIYYAEMVSERRRGNPGRSFILKDTAGVGCMADSGVYLLDTALHLMGQPRPVAVSGLMSNAVSRTCHDVRGARAGIEHTEVEDFAAAWVRFDNGAVLVVKTAWCMHMDTMGESFLLGTQAGLKIRVGAREGGAPDVVLYRDEFGVMTDVAMQNVHAAPDLFRLEDAAFAEAVRAGGPSPIDPLDLLATNVIIQGVIDSAAAGGREVEVAMLEV